MAKTYWIADGQTSNERGWAILEVTEGKPDRPVATNMLRVDAMRLAAAMNGVVSVREMTVAVTEAT